MILLTTREQKSRLSFYFASAVLFMWYSVEFGAVPDVSLPIGAGLIGQMKLALLVLLLYVVTLSQRLPDVGFTFSLNRSDWREALIHFALFAVIAVPFGLLPGFIKPSIALPSFLEIAGRGMFLFLFMPAPSAAMPAGPSNRAADPIPSLLPSDPALPARVVTDRVARTIFRIVSLCMSETQRFPAPSAATPPG